MQADDVKSNQELLKKMRGKAELCRFSHSELKDEYSRRRNRKEFSVVFLSVILVALVNFYFREMLKGDFVLSLIWILPLVTTLLQTLDCTIFRWSHKVARHESAVAIWGDWIREADFLEKRIHQHASDLAEEKMQNIQEKYNSCMGSTEQIPNNKFLKYKEKFRVHVLKSKKIDEMPLEDVEGK